MAFEEQPLTPPPSPVTRVEKTRDNSAFIGIIIGVIVLAGILFLFRNQIAAKIAEWRGTGAVTTSTRPNPPITVSPAPSTPTPTATATTTPRPGTITPSTSTPGTSIPGDSFPEAGPADTALLGLIGTGGLTTGAAAIRYRVNRRKLKKQLSNLDIA